MRCSLPKTRVPVLRIVRVAAHRAGIKLRVYRHWLRHDTRLLRSRRLVKSEDRSNHKTVI